MSLQQQRPREFDEEVEEYDEEYDDVEGEHEEGDEGNGNVLNASTQQLLEKNEQLNELRKTEKRREVRRKYGKLMKKTTDSRKDLIAPTQEKLGRILNEGNELHSLVAHAREGAMDAEWFKTTTKYGLERVQSVKLSRDWDVNSFLNNIRQDYTTYSNDEPKVDWTGLGNNVLKYFTIPPGPTFMKGPLSKDIKVRKIVRKKRETFQETAVQANTKPDENENDKKGASRNVVKLRKRIENIMQKKNKPNIHLLDALIDENSYSQTVENLFYFSFLIKDGSGTFSSNDDGDLTVSIVSQDAEAERKQSVISINLDQYQKLVRQKRSRKEASSPPKKRRKIT